MTSKVKTFIAVLVSVVLLCTCLSSATASNSVVIKENKKNNSYSSPSSSNKSVSTGAGTRFIPTLAKSLHKSDWYSSGFNRALLALTLGFNAGDDKVLGSSDIPIAIMHNPTFVGKDSQSNNYVVGCVDEDYYIIIYCATNVSQAIVELLPNNNGIYGGAIALESVMSSICSSYYRVTEEEMSKSISYVQSLLD